MGRKKKKTTKPWCWYCNREFEDEKILLQHQKAKHFKCHICHKKLFTGPGLQIHCMQVHKENIDRVPNSIKGRDNITLEICGMDNIPEADLIEHDKLKTISTRDDDSDSPDTEASPISNKPPYPPVPPPQSKPPATTPIHGPLPLLQPPPPPMPGTNPMMQQMMMYPHMAQMMAMNPMLMQQMMSMPGGMMPPHPPLPGQGHPPPPPPPPTQPSNQPPPPQPLMSLMGVSTKPPQGHMPFVPDHNSIQHLPPKPLFPAAAAYSNDLNQQVSSHLNDPSFIAKVENAAPGSKIVHPDEDISLEEFRASHHKYKYKISQYSSPTQANRLPGVNVMHQNGSHYSNKGY